MGLSEVKAQEKNEREEKTKMGLAGCVCCTCWVMCVHSAPKKNVLSPKRLGIRFR